MGAAWTPFRLSDCDTPLVTRNGVLDVWSMPLDLSGADVTLCASMLCPEERDRADRFVQPRDRRRYIVAHASLRVLLATYAGTRANVLRYTVGSHGKPALAGEAASRIAFNLSHSGELALLGVTREACVGVDIEILHTIDDAKSIARSFFAPGEIAALAAVEPADADAAFLRCWTRKEAYIKALGGGLSIPLDGFEVDISRAHPSIRHLGDDTTCVTRWTMIHLEPHQDYIGAAAVPGTLDEVRCRRLDPSWCGMGLAHWM